MTHTTKWAQLKQLMREELYQLLTIHPSFQAAPRPQVMELLRLRPHGVPL